MPQTIRGTSKLLIDSGSESNLIEISVLLDQVIVYKQQNSQLKGITEQLVVTLGSTTLNIHLEDKVIPTEFQVVQPDFPITQDEILGKTFMVSNNVIVDYQTNAIRIPDNMMINLQPRTETS